MLNNQQYIRQNKGFLIQVVLFTLFTLVIGCLTWVWWNDGGPNTQNAQWQLVFAKIAPGLIFGLYLIFIVWTKFAKKSIARDIIMPWVSCRCSLYTVVFIMPITITIVELIAIF